MPCSPCVGCAPGAAGARCRAARGICQLAAAAAQRPVASKDHHHHQVGIIVNVSSSPSLRAFSPQAAADSHHRGASTSTSTPRANCISPSPVSQSLQHRPAPGGFVSFWYFQSSSEGHHDRFVRPGISRDSLNLLVVSRPAAAPSPASPSPAACGPATRSLPPSLSCVARVPLAPCSAPVRKLAQSWAISRRANSAPATSADSFAVLLKLSPRLCSPTLQHVIFWL